jgi:hypothetical protein
MPSDDKRTAFAAKMSAVLNGGALNLALGIGYQDRDAGCHGRPRRPAYRRRDRRAAAGLDRRYVTEWLGIMACGGIVEVTNQG